MQTEVSVGLTDRITSRERNRDTMSPDHAKPRSMVIPSLGALGSVALHLLLIAPLVVGFGTNPKPKPLGFRLTEQRHDGTCVQEIFGG